MSCGTYQHVDFTDNGTKQTISWNLSQNINYNFSGTNFMDNTKGEEKGLSSVRVNCFETFLMNHHTDTKVTLFEGLQFPKVFEQMHSKCHGIVPFETTRDFRLRS